MLAAFAIACNPSEPVPFVESAPAVEGMIYVPTKRFDMGCDDCAPEEGPVHSAGVDGFYIDETEVTVAAFRAYCGDLRTCRNRAGAGEFEEMTLMRDSCNVGLADRQLRPEHPANCVSWLGARNYCATQRKRLPSEAEWELAARWDDVLRTYPWGEEEPTCDRAWYDCDDTDRKMTVAVGHLASGRSALGIADMAGNVAEWTESKFTETYDASASGDLKVVRGGSFKSGTEHLRGTARGGLEPGTTGAQIGFRCARSVEL